MVVTVFLICCVAGLESAAKENNDPAPPQELEPHLTAIAGLSQPSPMVQIPAGWFLMGTVRKDDDPFGLETQYDNTEFPQRRIWLDAYSLDRDEVSHGRVHGVSVRAQSCRFRSSCVI